MGRLSRPPTVYQVMRWSWSWRFLNARSQCPLCCVGMILKSAQESLDHNGNKSESEDREEGLLEKRLREEFRGKERVKVKMNNIDEIDR